jgi:hypothetical protein
MTDLANVNLCGRWLTPALQPGGESTALDTYQMLAD